MSNTQNDGIVRFVNTFTVSEWENKKGADRNPRKGITRVTKSTSQSIQKLQQTIKPAISIYRPNDENKNQINSHRVHQVPQIVANPSISSLLDHIKRLQNELGVVRVENGQLQRQVKRNRRDGLDGLIESHYITCKDDLDLLIKQKSQLTQKCNLLQEQNNFLKMNLGIQEQYIIKIQAEVNELRERKFNQLISGCHKETQTQNQQKILKSHDIQTETNINIQLHKPQNSDYPSQKGFKQQSILSHRAVQSSRNTQFDFAHGEVSYQYSSRTVRFSFGIQSEHTVEQKQVQNLQKMAKQFEQQTYQFTYLIQRLQQEKRELLLTLKKEQQQRSYFQEGNDKLMNQIDQLQRQIFNKQNIIGVKHEEARLQAMKQMTSLENDKTMLILKINQKNKQIQQIEGQLRLTDNLVYQKDIIIARLESQLGMKTIDLKQQEIRLHAEYQSYKQQLDYLLAYLEKQNQQLQQKQQFIDRKYENNEIIHFQKQKALQKQINIQAIVVHYQDRIKKIQGSFDECFVELQEHRRNERDMNYNLPTKNKTNQLNIQDQQKLFLRDTIDELNLKIANITAQNLQMYENQTRLQQKIMQKQGIISRLREEVLNLSKQYQTQATLCSKVKQQNLALYEKADNLTHMKEEVLLQMQTLTNRYQNQIGELQCQIHHIQSDLKMHIQKNLVSQQSYDLRIQEIKKDYDLLYTKYMKYKNVAKFLQTKANII